MKVIQLPGQSTFSLFTIRSTRDRFEFERTRVSSYGYPVSEMGEYAGMLPRKFISFHCLQNESNETQESNTEGTENFLDLPRGSESDVECSVGGESREKRLIDLEVVPVCEFCQESTEGVDVPNLPNVVESVQGDSHDETHIIVSHLLGESLEVLDDSGLRQLIENVPVHCETGIEEERSEAVVGGVGIGHFTETVTFLHKVMDLGVAIGLRRHQKMSFMRVVKGKLKDPRLKENVCCVRKLLLSKLEMEATKRV